MRLPNLHILIIIQHSWDLLRSHKIYWDLKRSTDLASYIWHLVFDIWHLVFDIWHAMTFDIDMPWNLTFDVCQLFFWHLTFDIWHGWRYWQHYHWYLWYWHNPITFSLTHSLNNIGLRDASASKSYFEAFFLA